MSRSSNGNHGSNGNRPPPEPGEADRTLEQWLEVLSRPEVRKVLDRGDSALTPAEIALYRQWLAEELASPDGVDRLAEAMLRDVED